MSDDKSSAAAKGVGSLVPIVIAGLLLFTNPSEFEVRQQIAMDGWVPVDYEHTNLLVLSFAKITGFMGGKAVYIGVAGNVFELGGGD